MENPFVQVADRLNDSRLLKVALLATATIGLTVGISGCKNIHDTDCGKFIMHAEGAPARPPQPCVNPANDLEV